MKKLAKISAVSAVAFALFGFTTFLAPSNFEGVIKYDIKIDSDNPQVAQFMQGSSMTTYIKGDMIKTETNMGMSKTITIANRTKPNDAVVLIEVMGNKYQMKMDDKTKKEAQGNMPEIKYLSGTKTIAGYACKEAQITFTDKKTGEKMATDVYYTDQLPYANNSDESQFKGLKGFPMSYSMKKNGVSMNFAVKSVEKQSVSDDEFKVPSGYKLMTPEDMQKDMMSHMNGGGN